MAEAAAAAAAVVADSEPLPTRWEDGEYEDGGVACSAPAAAAPPIGELAGQPAGAAVPALPLGRAARASHSVAATARRPDGTPRWQPATHRGSAHAAAADPLPAAAIGLLAAPGAGQGVAGALRVEQLEWAAQGRAAGGGGGGGAAAALGGRAARSRQRPGKLELGSAASDEAQTPPGLLVGLASAAAAAASSGGEQEALEQQPRLRPSPPAPLRLPDGADASSGGPSPASQAAGTAAAAAPQAARGGALAVDVPSPGRRLLVWQSSTGAEEEDNEEGGAAQQCCSPGARMPAQAACRTGSQTGDAPPSLPASPSRFSIASLAEKSAGLLSRLGTFVRQRVSGSGARSQGGGRGGAAPASPLASDAGAAVAGCAAGEVGPRAVKVAAAGSGDCSRAKRSREDLDVGGEAGSGEAAAGPAPWLAGGWCFGPPPTCHGGEGEGGDSGGAAGHTAAQQLPAAAPVLGRRLAPAASWGVAGGGPALGRGASPAAAGAQPGRPRGAGARAGSEDEEDEWSGSGSSDWDSPGAVRAAAAPQRAAQQPAWQPQPQGPLPLAAGAGPPPQQQQQLLQGAGLRSHRSLAPGRPALDAEGAGLQPHLPPGPPLSQRATGLAAVPETGGALAAAPAPAPRGGPQPGAVARRGSAEGPRTGGARSPGAAPEPLLLARAAAAAGPEGRAQARQAPASAREHRELEGSSGGSDEPARTARRCTDSSLSGPGVAGQGLASAGPGPGYAGMWQLSKRSGGAGSPAAAHAPPPGPAPAAGPRRMTAPAPPLEGPLAGDGAGLALSGKAASPREGGRGGGGVLGAAAQRPGGGGAGLLKRGLTRGAAAGPPLEAPAGPLRMGGAIAPQRGGSPAAAPSPVPGPPPRPPPLHHGRSGELRLPPLVVAGHRGGRPA
jgi:hypothetical protein